MTREEKIICKQFLNDADKTHSCNEYKMLIALLEQEPTTKNDLGVDCIDRAEVLKLMQDNWHTHNGDWAMQESMDDIRALPSVTPQEPRIITCKDCKYYRNKGNKRSYCTKRLNVDSVTDRYREPNFYCADAVLREVEKRQEKKQ